MTSILPITEEHQQSFYELSKRNLQHLADFFPITIEKTETPEKTAQSIRLYQQLTRQNDLHVFLISEEQKNEVVGLVILKNIDKKVNKCELVYFVDSNMQNRGYATDAVRQAVQKAFDSYGIQKIYCRVATYDTAGNRVAIKNGFELEGVLKKEFRISTGEIIDLNYYGLQKP